MNRSDKYLPLVKSLLSKYGNQLGTVVLFGSQARRDTRQSSDHDIFVVIDDLHRDPLRAAAISGKHYYQYSNSCQVRYPLSPRPQRKWRPILPRFCWIFVLMGYVYLVSLFLTNIDRRL